MAVTFVAHRSMRISRLLLLLLLFMVLISSSPSEARDIPRPEYKCDNQIFPEPWVAVLRGHGQRKSDYDQLVASCISFGEFSGNVNVFINKLVISLEEEDHDWFSENLVLLENVRDRQFLKIVKCIRFKNTITDCSSEINADYKQLRSGGYLPAVILDVRTRMQSGKCNANMVEELLTKPLMPSYEFQFMVVDGVLHGECRHALKFEDRVRLKVGEKLDAYVENVITGNRTEYYRAAGTAYWNLDEDVSGKNLVFLEEAARRGDIGSNILLVSIRMNKILGYYDLDRLVEVVCHPDNPHVDMWNSVKTIPFSCNK